MLDVHGFHDFFLISNAMSEDSLKSTCFFCIINGLSVNLKNIIYVIVESLHSFVLSVGQ